MGQAEGGHEATGALIERAWELSYFDAPKALALGRRIVARKRTEPRAVDAGWGWLHVALAEVRVGELAVAQEAAGLARAVFEPLAEQRGVALVDEVLAIGLRRQGDLGGCAALHEDIDRRKGIAYTDHDRFIAYNSRAITAKLVGRNDDALRHFYRACAAAQRSGWNGPHILALGNLGGFHQDLFNLDDARTMLLDTLNRAREAQARQSVATTVANLIITHHALGQKAQARAMAEFMLTHGDEMLPGALERHTTPLALGFYCSGELDQAQHFLDRGAIGAVADGDGKALWTWLQSRVLLERGQAAAAAVLAGSVLQQIEAGGRVVPPYDLMQLYRAAADASEAIGDLAAALRFTRQSQTQYEDLVGRSARARYIAIEVVHEVDAARAERDLALQGQRSAEDDRERLVELNRQLRNQIAATEALQHQLREQALRDPLTSLHNRRYLFEVAPRHLELAQRRDESLCVVLLDLDRFKALNDNFGHDAGDAMLKAFASLLEQSLRRTDIVCRHGGEEFVVVMPDISLAGAEAMLERLLDAYQQMRVSTPRQMLPPSSFSAGIAVFPAHGETLDQLLSRADRALYQAKEGGRARIEAAQTTNWSTL
jgi:diguanylate cyclase (GGDEF)-like protein